MADLRRLAGNFQTRGGIRRNRNATGAFPYRYHATADKSLFPTNEMFDTSGRGGWLSQSLFANTWVFHLMNVPQEQVDQLLSGYLDDALTADERAEVQTWLRVDASIAAQYDELISIRRALRSIASTDRHLKVRAGFSDRVMEASVARARAEGFADEHPLIQVSEQPTSLAVTPPTKSWAAMTIALVAVAACLAMIFVGLRPDEGGIANRLVEQAESDPSGGLDSVISATPNMIAESVVPNLSVPEESAIEAIDRTVVTPKPVPSSDANVDSEVSMIASAERSELSTPAYAAKAGSTVAVSQIAPSRSDSLNVVLVIDIQLTETGRAVGAVRKAMRSASILQTNQQAVGSDVLRATLVAAGEEDQQPVSLFYIQAPAKRLDQFYLRMLADDAGVASVGMTIATNIPILNAINAIDFNATEIQHDGLLQVADPASGMNQLGTRLGQLSFLPFDPAMVSATTTDSGPDFPTQVLVRVR